MSGDKLRLSAILLFALGSGWTGLCAPAAAPDQGASGSYAVIAVSVFREPGFALPGAEVTLTPDSTGQVPAGHKKPKKLRGITSPRGEYAFRVPPGPMRYTLKASAKEYKPAEKAVEVQASERVDVTVTLERSSKE